MRLGPRLGNAPNSPSAHIGVERLRANTQEDETGLRINEIRGS
jgi:hypothetical protein